MGARAKKVRLGDLLQREGLISEQQVQDALAEQKRSGLKLGRIFIQRGIVSEQQIMDTLAHQLGMPVVDLRHYSFDEDVARLLPETHARRFRALPVGREDNGEITVAMADPTDLFGYDEIARITGHAVSVAIAREADILRSIDIIHRRTDEILDIASEMSDELEDSRIDLDRLADTQTEEDAPVIRLLQTLFEDATQVEASDIHVEPDEHVLRIRQRIDGVLHEQEIGKRSLIAPSLVTRLKLMANLNISEKRLPQDGRFNIQVRGRVIDVRLSTMPVLYGESVVMRLLDRSAGTRSLKDIAMPEAMAERFRKLIRRKQGMVLVTGPTGSGKTTTLYAGLNDLDRKHNKIITIEDPVEYTLDRISQIQVRPQIGLDFATVLRSVLRQDPDIIMVGEMRDRETVDVGLRASMTGHMVFSTLHTNSAVATIARLLDMGAPGYMIAAALDAVLAQRLMRRVCEACARETAPNVHERAWLVARVGEEAAASMRFRRGQGCTQCSNSGYRGRAGVYELLQIDEPLADALRAADLGSFARLAGQQKDFVSLSDEALRYAAEGITSLQEAMRVAGSEQLDVGPLAARATDL